jgi:hypothetical protein
VSMTMAHERESEYMVFNMQSFFCLQVATVDGVEMLYFFESFSFRVHEFESSLCRSKNVWF